MAYRFWIPFLLLLSPACQKDAPGWSATGGNLCSHPEAYTVTFGRVRHARVPRVSRWFGRSPTRLDLEESTVLGDDRDALIFRTPTRVLLSVPPAPTPRRFRTSLRRLPWKGRGGSAQASREQSLLCEVFAQASDGAPLRSLARVELPDDPHLPALPWADLEATLPAGFSGSLELVCRWANSGLASTIGPEVAWANPRLLPPPSKRHPDVLILTVDTLRADAMERAPGLRAILSRGISWPRAVAPSNWTLPSYASLFTDLEADQHGAGRGPFPPVPGGPIRREFHGIRPELTTLAEIFRREGYATCMIYQNPFLEPWGGLDRGFERYVRTSEDTAYGAEVASAWWEGASDRPRFLVLHLMAPHHPYDPPRIAGLSDHLPPDPLDALDLPKLFGIDHTPEERAAFFALPAQARKDLRRRYDAEVAVLDQQISPWLEELLRGPQPPILAFHADHGEEFWDDGSYEHGHSFSEAVIRVPIGIVWPGHLSPAVHPEPVGAHWLGASCARLAGLDLPSSWRADLFHPLAITRSVGTLYRSRHGGREYDLRSGRDHFLPLDPGFLGNGPAATLDPSLRQALESLGY